MTDQTKTPRTDALLADLYSDAVKRKQYKHPAQEPTERWDVLCRQLERENVDLLAKLADEHDRGNLMRELCKLAQERSARALAELDVLRRAVLCAIDTVNSARK